MCAHYPRNLTFLKKYYIIESRVEHCGSFLLQKEGIMYLVRTINKFIALCLVVLLAMEWITSEPSLEWFLNTTFYTGLVVLLVGLFLTAHELEPTRR